MSKLDKELEEFRNVMQVPDSFEDGFKLSSFVGTLFIALVMIPGTLYMELVAGMGVGAAAQWVTVILFIEVVKRMNQKLSRAQIFLLFYMAGAITAQSVHGTPLFTQFLVRSEAAISSGISTLIPSWVAPIDPAAYAGRTFFRPEWIPVLALIAFKMLMSRVDNMVLSFGLFRVTNDIERLPFPLAPIGAQGVMALAEDLEERKDEQSHLRWRIFAIGGALGMVFGFLYMGWPTLTGALFGKPYSILPIPFTDFTPYTKNVLPAVATGLSFDLGQFILGMVMPFFAMVGTFIGLIVTFVANPLLYKFHVLRTWQPGQTTVETLFNNNIDLYFSLTIGISLAVAAFGIIQLVRHARSKDPDAMPVSEVHVKARGNMPGKFIVFFYFISMIVYILVCGWLIHWHKGVMVVLLFFGFIYTPLFSYVTARLEGLAGQVVEIPFITQIAFILSGYQGVAIWFLPIPKANYGMMTVFYKQAELTGTSFWSIWKADFFLFPIIILSVVCFSSFIWGIAEIPSGMYPYAQQIWDFEARNACLVYSSTLGEYSQFYEALSGVKVAIGFGLGMLMFAALSVVGAPILLIYGVVRGLNQTLPHVVIPQILGALVGRYYFAKRFGSMKWRTWVPILSAGYFCGAGLVATFCIGIVFLTKASSKLPF
ncbi:MAG: peptide transporter [Spirochaetes bacterium]|nr:peptide transporter [Spirochaetota bacterium]